MQEHANRFLSNAPKEKTRPGRRLFGLTGLFVGMVGGALIASLIWWRTDAPVTQNNVDMNSAAISNRLEQRIDGLELRVQRTTAEMEAAMQAASNRRDAELAETKKTVEHLQAFAARLPDVESLKEEIAQLQTTAAQVETLMQKLATLDQETAAKLSELEATVGRAADLARSTARGPRTGAVSRRAYTQPTPPPNPINVESAIPTGTSMPVPIEPAAGTEDNGFWRMWPPRAGNQIDDRATRGAETSPQ